MILNPAWDARVPRVKPGGNQSCDLCGEDLPFQGVTSKTTPYHISAKEKARPVGRA